MASNLPNQRTVDPGQLDQPDPPAQATSGDRELSDDELEAVSGGFASLFRLQTKIVGKFDDSAKNVIQKLSQG